MPGKGGASGTRGGGIPPRRIRGISNLAVSSDTISIPHTIEFSQPTPVKGFNWCGSYPAHTNTGVFTRDLVNFPADLLPSGGPCPCDVQPGGCVISASEMVMAYLYLQNWKNPSSGTVTMTWKNKDTGATLYTFQWNVGAPDPSWSYWWENMWSFIGHYDASVLGHNEINQPGNYQCIISTPWGNAAIDFTVIDSTPTPSNANVFNICWGTSQTPPCSIPPQLPAVPAGTAIKIEADIANAGGNGKVRAVFKANGVQISDQNSTLNTYPGGGLWSPQVSYTMPSGNVTLEVDAYGWNGTTWVQTDSKSLTISVSAPVCSSIVLTPYSQNVNAGDKITLTATVTPSNTAFTVVFNNVFPCPPMVACKAPVQIGSASTVNGVATITWDTTGLAAGTYYVAASVASQCTSAQSAINVSVPITQWNVKVYAFDKATSTPVAGASVSIGTQTLTTDSTGLATFRVNQGQVYVTVSKSGYNTITDTQLIYSDDTLNYYMVASGAATGSIAFVSVPSAAEIFLDDTDQNQKTPITLTNVPAGDHTFTLKLAGYNDATGTVTVLGGSTENVYVSMTPSSPTTGSLNIVSTPGGAEVFIDGVDQKTTTTTTITGIAPGSHTVKLTKAGYDDYTAAVTITAGTTAYMSAVMIALSTTGTLEISSVPTGARVFIDGTDQSLVTPATVTDIPAGSHTYRLVLAGYSDAKGTFTVTAGQTAVISATLTKLAGAAAAGYEVPLIVGATVAALVVVGIVASGKG